MIEDHKLVIGDKKYQIRQHSATEGCALIENHFNAIRAFMLAQQTQYVYNQTLIPFAARFEGYFLALLMFMDRLAVDEPFSLPDAGIEQAAKPKLSLRQLLDGKTLEDVAQETTEPPSMSMSYSVDYKASQKMDNDLDYERELSKFLKYVTFEDEPVELDALSFYEIATMLGAFIEHNVLHIWTKERFNLPLNYKASNLEVRSLQNVAKTFSQTNVIYNILNCEKPLATLTDLKMHMSVEDAYDANEIALRMYYEQAEVQKETERQSKNN